MPNWVYNTLTIQSQDADLLAAVKAKLAQPYDTHYPKAEYDHDKKEWVKIPNTQTHEDVLSFWNIVAPTDLDAYYESEKPKPADISHADLFAEFEHNKAESNNWYWWNVRNWGSKWDACEVSLQIDEPNTLSYRFDTAWAPPLPAIEALCEQYPELLVTLHFEEEQGWGGEITTQHGTVINKEEWDIPESHADYELREQECSRCLYPYTDANGEWKDLDMLFDDCPRDFLEEADA